MPNSSPIPATGSGRTFRILLSGFYPNYRYGLATATLRSYLLNDAEISTRAAIDVDGFALALTDDKVASSILRKSPDLLGFSCYVWNIEKILRACARLRGAGFASPIVLGGPEATHTAARLLEENPAVTMVVRGEGEETLRLLVRRYLGLGGGFNEIAGISYRDGVRVVETADRPPIPDLSVIPSPYLDGTVDLHGPDIQYGLGCYETYRGCIFSCAFCLWATIKSRAYPIERVERELLAIMNSKVERVWFADAVANLDKDRFKRILRLMTQKNTNKVFFDFEIVAEMLDDETIELLAALPGGYMACGLQSTDPGAIKNSRRFSNLARFRNNIERLRRLNGKIELFIDLIYGLPGDTLESYRRSVDFALSFAPDRLQTHQLRVFPGTPFHRDAAKLGLVHDERPPYFVRRTPTFSQGDIVQAQRLGSIMELYNHVPPVRIAAALAGRACGATLAALERLVGPLGAVTPRTTLGQLSTALEGFLACEGKSLPPGAGDVLKDYGRYFIRGLMTDPRRLRAPDRKSFRLQADQLRYDFARILATRNLLNPDADWQALPQAASWSVFNEAALEETIVHFLRRHVPHRPTLPHELAKRRPFSTRPAQTGRGAPA